MKKVKIMLLSLALFAVVGGALAFKAKFDQTWCVAAPYVSGQLKYCSFQQSPGVFTTKHCGSAIQNLTNNDGTVFSCTSIVDGNNCNTDCPQEDFTTLNR